MNVRTIIYLLLLFFSLPARSDEGMWMINNLDKKTRSAMKELGLQLSANQIYHTKKSSLKDAIVNFGGFCSGVVVSEEGLVFTNHHCGFSAIQQHSTPEHNYIQDGFVASTRQEELPNPDLYVRFLVSSEEVTHKINKTLKAEMDEPERASVIDSVCFVLQEEVMDKDTTLVAIVDSYYGGNAYYLNIYRDYNDVRLVYAPPSSVGKFGWDTDNWEWPRHTGDFAIFRIYSTPGNEPADYSPENVPYHPPYVVPLSIAGYQEGDFSMTIGYPGETERYFSSYAIEERMNTLNEALVHIRGVKQAIWKREMDKSSEVHIKYASKYDESSNYWKNSIGMNRSIEKLHVLERKQDMEAHLRNWIRQQPTHKNEYLRLFTELELAYRNREAGKRAIAYFMEAFLNSSELVQLSLEILNFDFEDEPHLVEMRLKQILEKYDNLDLAIDKEVFIAMLEEYPKHVEEEFYPFIYTTIEKEYDNNYRAYAEELFSSTKMTTPEGLRLILENDTTFQLFEDPGISLALDLLIAFYDMNQSLKEPSEKIEHYERLYNQAIREMYSDRSHYPDANFSMRLSLGWVSGYSPADGIDYNYFTTTEGIFEKVLRHQGDPDFYVQPELLSLLEKAEFGPYQDKEGELRVCFITNNDITGGNSGSPVFNSKGELTGLAFDGNWEAMSSDFAYEPTLQRCIAVDVRYMLFMMEHYGKAASILKELKINQ
ncbi:MAG: S46 family peptidase [Bacteroides sp.]|nr:S46 family peptidase [Bacteroides sp.]